MLFDVARFIAPAGKTRSSPATGIMFSAQFAAVVQFALDEPSQVRVAARPSPARSERAARARIECGTRMFRTSTSRRSRRRIGLVTDGLRDGGCGRRRHGGPRRVARAAQE